MYQRVLLCGIICSLITLSACYVPIKGGRHSIKPNEEHHDEKKHDEVVYPLIVENHDLTPTALDKNEANHKQSDKDLKSILEDVNKSAVEEHNHKSTTYNDNKQEDIELSQSKKDTSVTHTENHQKKNEHGVQHIHKEVKQSSHHDEKQIVIQNGPVLDHNEHKDHVEDEHKLLFDEDHLKVSISDLIKKNEERKHFEDSLVISNKDNPSIYHVEQHTATDGVTIDDQQKVSRDYHSKNINIDVPVDQQHKVDFGIFKKTDGEFVGIDQTQKKDVHETSFHDNTQHKVDFNVFKQDDHQTKEDGFAHTEDGGKIEKHYLGEKDIIVNTEKNHGHEVVFGGIDTEVKNHDSLPYDCKNQDGTNCGSFEKRTDLESHYHDDKKIHETSFGINQHSSAGSEHKHDVIQNHGHEIVFDGKDTEVKKHDCKNHDCDFEKHDDFVGSTINKGNDHDDKKIHETSFSVGQHSSEGSEHKHVMGVDKQMHGFHHEEHEHHHVPLPHKAHGSFGKHYFEHHHSTSGDHHDHHFDGSHVFTSTSEEKDDKFKHPHFQPHHHWMSGDHHHDQHFDDSHKDDKLNPHFKPHHSMSGDHHHDQHFDDSHKDEKFNPHFKPHHSMSGDDHHDQHFDDSHKDEKFNPHFKPHHSMSGDHHHDQHFDDSHKYDKLNPHFKPHHSMSGDHHHDQHFDDSHKDDKFNPHFKPHHSMSGDHHHDQHFEDSHKDDKFNPHFKPHHSMSGDHHHDQHFDDSHKFISSSEECDDKDGKFKHPHFQPHYHHPHPHHYHGFHDYHQTKHHVKNGHFHHH